MSLKSTVLILIFASLTIFSGIITAVITIESQNKLETLLDAKLRQTAQILYTQTDAWITYQKRLQPNFRGVILDDSEDDDEVFGDDDRDDRYRDHHDKKYRKDKRDHKYSYDPKDFGKTSENSQELSWIDKNIMAKNLDFNSPLTLQIFNNLADFGLGEKNILVSKKPKRIGNTPITSLKWGHDEVLFDGKLWRTFSYSKKGDPLLVIIAEPHPSRLEIAKTFLLNLLVPFLVFIPLMALLVVYIVNRGFFPLKKIAQILKHHNPARDLGPLPDMKLPQEITPMIRAINSLLTRVAESIENERQFTDDAAHELRTPLAAINAQVGVALQTHDEIERKNSLKHIEQTTCKMTDILDHLLLLARLDHENIEHELTLTPLRPLIQDVMADLGERALQKNITVTFNEAQYSAMINEHLGKIMLHNLIENAIKFTPMHGLIEVFLLNNSEYITLEIHDSGPGLGDIDQKNVFKRFFRGKNSARKIGSGLGLAIVHKISALHNITITMGISKHKGLLVTLTFPHDSSKEM